MDNNNNNEFEMLKLADKPGDSIDGKSNSIMVPSTLKDPAESKWRRIRNRFTAFTAKLGLTKDKIPSVESKIQNLGEKIANDEKTVANNSNIIGKLQNETDDRIQKIVAVATKENIKLEDELVKLKDKKFKLVEEQKYKKSVEETTRFLKDLNLDRTKLFECVKTLPLADVKSLVGEMILKQAIANGYSPIQNYAKEGQALSELKKEEIGGTNGDIPLPDIKVDNKTAEINGNITPESSLPIIKSNPTYDNGNALAQNLAAEVNEIISNDPPKKETIETVGSPKTLIDKLKEQSKTATETNKIKTDLEQEQQKNIKLQKEMDDMRKLIKEYEDMRRENEELKYSKKTLTQTAENLKADMEKIGLESSGIRQELADAHKEIDTLNKALTEAEIREDLERQDKENAVNAAKYFASNLYGMIPFVDNSRPPMDLMPELNGWVDDMRLMQPQDTQMKTAA